MLPALVWKDADMSNTKNIENLTLEQITLYYHENSYQLEGLI
jgi:hypothetical protein